MIRSIMRRRDFLKAGALAAGGLLANRAGLAAETASASHPSILFCSPTGVYQGQGGGNLDLEYLRELHAQGFEVDYTNSLDEITWDRIKHYNVLMLISLPGSAPGQPGKSNASLRSAIERYVRAGGGLFLMPYIWVEGTGNYLTVAFHPFLGLLKDWGAEFPYQCVYEANPANLGPLLHEFTFNDKALAYTEQILPSPVSAGVKGIWYPNGVPRLLCNSANGPVAVDAHWQVVVKASPNAHAVNYGMQPKNHPLSPSIPAPPLFAIRQVGAGRVAVVNQWPPFSIGSGTKWTYDRQVLSRGCHGKPSDFGRLLENTFRWLAEPSLRNKAVGGYVTSSQTLVAPNMRPAIRKQYEYGEAYWRNILTQWHRPPRFAPVYRGLIGAKTTYSSGSGTVKEYAAAAKKAGLQFVVFLDDFANLTPEKWTRLKADCQRHSDADILLLAGFTIEANTGDHIFFYTLNTSQQPGGPWPPDSLLGGPHKTLFKLMHENAAGQYTDMAHRQEYLWWSLITFAGIYEAGYPVRSRCRGGWGFYHFTANPKAMPLWAVNFGVTAAAIRYYKDGQLVEDQTDAYLTAAQGTYPLVPVSLNEVRSPAELTREVESGHALTHVQADSVPDIFVDGLRPISSWNAYNTFPSAGPVIHAWPAFQFVETLGAEPFVTLPAIMVARLEVSDPAGLKEITIYNGKDLFRRFRPGGAKRFNETLLLEADIERTLVVIAVNEKGGQAVSYPRASVVRGTNQVDGEVMFCPDHANDCNSQPLLARGAFLGPVTIVPALAPDIAGSPLGDGGPEARILLVNFNFTGANVSTRYAPQLVTDQGEESAQRFYAQPELDYTDYGSAAVASRYNDVYAASVPEVVVYELTPGPCGGPSKLMEFTERFWEYYGPITGVPATDAATHGIVGGDTVCLFRQEFRFKLDFTVRQLKLLQNEWNSGVTPVNLLLGKAPAAVTKTLEYSDPKTVGEFHLSPGDWFALYTPQVACSHIFIVRQQPIRLQIHGPGSLTIFADIAGKKVQAGDTYAFELFSVGVMVNQGLKSQAQVTRLLNYLHQPAGMNILRGQRVDSPGFIECIPDDGAVEVIVPRPKWKTNLTLPLRVKGLNRRWSAGLFQKNGYVLGNYGTGKNRYRNLGVDVSGHAYVPMYVDRASQTHMVAGHPIIADVAGADAAGEELFIGVVHLHDDPQQWHISVNNPTDRYITTTLHKTMNLPGLIFPDTKLTLAPGEYRVLVS